MLALFQTILILVAITLWLFRAEKVVVKYLNRYQAPETSPVTGNVAEDEGMPADLAAMANGYSEDWAKNQTLDAIWEQYGKLKDWQKVRQALGFSSGTI